MDEKVTISDIAREVGVSKTTISRYLNGSYGYMSDKTRRRIEQVIEQTGYVLYYTNQCPFNAKYVPVLLEVAREREVPFKATRLETKEEAQNAPTPVTTYALFYNGEYVTNEQMNDKRFIKLLDGMKK